ncbi:hypothetical protein EDD37DRAFT_606437 [Exophiala viscosa]|uniref:Uncharacterized protein n=1 Tax=Exophiala viscosa TaxID=2486360 RepID=A0AAN6E608_9EURO|nr:hypothetical protein EDD36DRAFT_33553 [Exophiala viscosa]KAI1627642.1 hypothetical protein EDD37DRAFT_606437 [Exophiala viscosa]
MAHSQIDGQLQVQVHSTPFTGTRSTTTRNNQSPDLSAFFIHSTEHPQGQIFFATKPAASERNSISPLRVKRPIDPTKTKHSLEALTPCTLFVQYRCKTKCRSLGICVHYQFVIGCRRCPDGLRCPRCMASPGSQEAIHASRPCPLHQDLAQANPIENRPEDFLATDAQKALCDEILRRASEGQWEDIPEPETKRDDAMGGVEQDLHGFQWEGEQVQERAHPEPQPPSNAEGSDGIMDTVIEEDAGTDDDEDGKTITGEASVEVPAHTLPSPGGCAGRIISPALLGGPLGMQTYTYAANGRRAG